MLGKNGEARADGPLRMKARAASILLYAEMVTDSLAQIITAHPKVPGLQQPISQLNSGDPHTDP